MADPKHTKVLIIGSGPAGYTAAIYAARANLKPVQILGMEPGGQLTITTEVENYPGFADPIQGPWLMEQMQGQAQHVGTEMIYDMVSNVDFSKRPYTVTCDGGDVFTADTVVICTGAKARWLGLPSEQQFRNMGVSACATCDGFFFKNKRVAVVGGGNSAVEEALFLSNICEHVTLIHRRDTLRAERIAQDRLFARANVSVIWNAAVEEVKGIAPGGAELPGVTGLLLKDTVNGSLQEIAVEGMFVAIGHDPATELFKGKLELDKEGYIITAPDSTATNIPGVYAAGDVKDKIYRQAVTAAGMGCMAALEADRYITALEAEHDKQQAEAAE
ncbi:MAG: thioredoxin-disulfide reductase [Micavibrio aeruginosavorus]|uniref:Thioredoxin reductase n=1 Tax=Micavibrio aeruginosavorus TaxID=349221 RepID=A0A2W5BJM2_9BACT|nr:MAG: thioredoxin-disulfide reductase [Micavibrio aeruginosavorus]